MLVADKWAEIVSADVEMCDESAQSFPKRQTQSPLFQATSFRNLMSILEMDHKAADSQISKFYHKNGEFNFFKTCLLKGNFTFIQL